MMLICVPVVAGIWHIQAIQPTEAETHVENSSLPTATAATTTTAATAATTTTSAATTTTSTTATATTSPLSRGSVWKSWESGATRSVMLQ